jgi:hypothetical protein
MAVFYEQRRALRFEQGVVLFRLRVILQIDIFTLSGWLGEVGELGQAA